MLATKVGGNTILAQIIELMKKARAAKPPVQKLGDQVAAIFVPVVILIALLTFGITYFAAISCRNTQVALMHAIAVLVIYSATIYGISYAYRLMVGLGRAAKNGILIKAATPLKQLPTLNMWFLIKQGH